MEIIQKVWPGDNPFIHDRHQIMKAVKHELGPAGARSQLQRLCRQPLAVPLRHAHAAERDLRSRSAPRRCSRPGTPRSTWRRSRTTGSARWSPTAAISTPPARCCASTAGCGSSTSCYVISRRRDRPWRSHADAWHAAAHPYRPQISARAVARIAAFMRGLFARSDAAVGGRCRGARRVLPRGTRVYLSAVPHRPAEEVVSAAIRLRAAGLEPVPHLAVRNFASADALDDFLARLNGEAEVRRLLVIAGDRGEHGPFRSAVEVIDSGLFRRHGIREIGIAGYPDGHPRIGNDALDRALAEKIAAAEAIGLAVHIVTQFCFDARRSSITWRGCAISASSIRCASGSPARPAFRRCCATPAAAACAPRRKRSRGAPGMLRQMFAMSAPDDLVRALAEAAPSQVSAHFFSFGGLPPTARWAQAVADGRIVLEGPADLRSRRRRETARMASSLCGGEDAGREHSRREYRLRDRGRTWPLGGADHRRPARAR